jgi:hypothetical protein
MGDVTFGDRYAHLDFCDQSVKGPGHQPSAQQLHAMHLSFDAASAVVSAPVPPECPTQIS